MAIVPSNVENRSNAPIMFAAIRQELERAPRSFQGLYEQSDPFLFIGRPFHNQLIGAFFEAYQGSWAATLDQIRTNPSFSRVKSTTLDWALGNGFNILLGITKLKPTRSPRYQLQADLETTTAYQLNQANLRARVGSTYLRVLGLGPGAGNIGINQLPIIGRATRETGPYEAGQPLEGFALDWNLKGLTPNNSNGAVAHIEPERDDLIPNTRAAIDEQLATEFPKDEDGKVLAKVVETYFAPTLSLALRILGDRELAEETVNEAFERAYEKRARFDPSRGKLLSLLLTIVHHRSIDVLRGEEKFRRFIPISDSQGVLEVLDDDVNSNPYERLIIDEQRRRIRAALTEIPEEQRRPIELAYYGGLTQVQIADVLRQPLGTVKTRMRLAYLKLRLLLADLK